MHDALTIAIPTLTVIFAALLNRNDVQALRGELHAFRIEIRGDMDQLRIEIRGDMDQLRTEIRGDMDQLRTEIRGELDTFRTEIRADMQNLRLEMKSDLKDVSNNLILVRERLAKVEQRVGVTSAAG